MVNKTGFTVGNFLNKSGCSSAWCHTQYFLYTKSKPIKDLIDQYQRRYCEKMQLGVFYDTEAHFDMTEIASVIFILQHNG